MQGARQRDGDQGPEDVAGPQSQGLRVVASQAGGHNL
jgi:hypothetical protein